MVPTPRTYTSSSRSKPTLEIIPNTRFIVFNGSEHEAQPFKLTGVCRLTTPESMSIQRPRVKLEGKRKISWWYMGGISAGEVVDKRNFWVQEQKLGGIESAHKIKAGVIEWPFEFELSPSMPESVEGFRETFIVYHLHAAVSRPGWNAKDVAAQEHIRIVRTLGQDQMEMTRSRVNADIWANKISYSISIPTDAIVFGTSITADVELSPIKKGLRLGKVELRLIENTVKRIQASEVPDARGDRSKSEEHEVAKTEMEFPEHSRIMYDDETVDNPAMADEMYKFKATLQLPKSLNECRQDVDSHQINITHRFKLMVNIHNPEGHVSQLVCRLPVKLFISPNLPVDESNAVCGTTNGLQPEELNESETTLTAPPEYGRHLLDQLFNDIDPGAYMSRAPSAPGTPGGFGAQSRRGSNENLASLNGTLSDLAGSLPNGAAGGTPEEGHGSALPSALRSRLADLQERGSAASNRVTFSNPTSAAGTPPIPNSLPNGSGPAATGREDSPPRSNPYFFASSSNAHTNGSPSHSSTPTSRRVSDEQQTSEIQQNDYNLASLSRVPSYGAALRQPTGHMTPFTDVPPSYQDATSRPPSPPQSAAREPGSEIQRPPGAHMRPGEEDEGVISQPMGTGGANVMARSHRQSAAAGNDDSEARLRMLRARV